MGSSFLKVFWFNYLLLDLFCPVSLSFFWSFGFFIGVFLIFQVLSGLFLSFYFSSFSAFDSVSFLIRESCFGCLLRVFHINGVTFFFLGLYFHVFRGISFYSFLLTPVFISGVFIFFLSVLVGFLGYSLPWAQMSYWAASVITNLSTAFPFFGGLLAQFIWGGFSLNDATLFRFFSLHFFLPFVIIFLVFFHVLFLHIIHSQSPVSLNSDGVKFFPFFFIKDLLSIFSSFFFFFLLLFFFSYLFLENEIFEVANPLMSPEHIVPEWYFLPFYAVLRVVPSKLGGVLLMLSLFIFLFFLCFSNGNYISFFSCLCLYFWLYDWLILFWIGILPVVFPFDLVGKFSVLVFFLGFFFL